jgi:hypothetical protein
MGYTLTQEERIVLSELQSDLIKTKVSLINWGIGILKYIIVSIQKFIFSLEEFRWVNIKKQGLAEILYQRALRFFKLQEEAVRTTSDKRKFHNKERNPNKTRYYFPLKGVKRAIKRLLKYVFRMHPTKKQAKNVYQDKFG